MTLTLKEPEAVRPASQIQGLEIDARKNASSDTQSVNTNGNAFSIARRVVVVSVAGQALLASGLVALVALYAGVQVAVFAGLAALLVLFVGNLIVIRTVRRGLDPLAEIAGRAGRISMNNWALRLSPGSGMAAEVAPLASAVDAAIARIQTATRQQRNFTSDAAHELKTSVAIVKSSLQLLLHRPRTQREYELGLEELLGDCARLEGLLDRMLRLSRIDQMNETGATPKSVSVDLISTCEAALSRIHLLAEQHCVELRFEASPSACVLADPDDLELIWINLLENAVQNSPPNSTVEVRVNLASNGMVQVAVLDSGPGIPPAEFPHIFERFRQADGSPARRPCGFGLGLAICKAVVESYGGTIQASNLPERGAEFRVHLPVQPN